jgi:opacity protein-like surface antigen
MRYSRLQLFAASAILVITNACAPDAAVNGLANVSNDLSRPNVDKFQSDRLSSLKFPAPENRDVAYNPAYTVNGRFGIWFNNWSAVSLDSPFFIGSEYSFNQTVVSATPLLFLRARFLKSDSVPNGHLQPYIGIGPGLFFSNQEMSIQRDSSSKLDAGHMSVGIDLRTGIRWQLSRNLKVFSEYRMTHYKSDRINDDKATFLSKETGDSTLTTSNFMGGLTFTF